ncbi:hypothetical protein [Sphingopyxis sp.]|jgi:hypothetical protein|uniref:hypothetical protein n=1 Tax=Sphingopyxis sp. TaxID=1908224 RepID=UPI00311FA3F1
MKTMTPRAAALAILTDHYHGLSWKGCQFLGQVAGLPDRPLSPKQSVWLQKLCEEAGLSVEGVAA